MDVRRTGQSGGRAAFVLVTGLAALCGPAAAEAADELDWSVGLRGSFASSSSGGTRYEAVAAPEVSITLGGEGGTLTLGAGAELALDAVGIARFADVRAAADGSYAIDSDSSLAGSADISLTQGAPEMATLPTNTAIAPLVLSGAVEGSGTTRLGPAFATARVSGSRQLQGDETLYDATIVDHSSDSYWRDGAGIRVGFEVSPMVSVFADADVTDTYFDAPSPSLLVSLDNRVIVLRGGVAFTQGSVVSSEASIGPAFIDYGDGSVADAEGWVADASLTFTPDEALTFSAGLESSIGPSGSVAGDTDVVHRVAANTAYRVNSWMTLRSSAGASASQTLAAGTVGFSYDAGVGLDLASTAHTVWSADYRFAHDGGTPEDTHTVTVGLTVKR